MNVMAVIIGGLVGANLRYMSGEWLTSTSLGMGVSPFPLGTMILNLVGCLVLGWFLTASSLRMRLPGAVRVGISTGLIGSFTTFSTFSVETLELAQAGEWVLAALYVIISVLGGVLLAVAGWYLARMPVRTKEGRA